MGHCRNSFQTHYHTGCRGKASFTRSETNSKSSTLQYCADFCIFYGARIVLSYLAASLSLCWSDTIFPFPKQSWVFKITYHFLHLFSLPLWCLSHHLRLLGESNISDLYNCNKGVFFWYTYINDFWLCVLYKKWSSEQRNRKKHSINQQAPTFLWYGQTTKSSSEQNKTTVLALSGSCGEKIGMCRVRGWGESQSPRVLKSPPANTKLLWKHSVGGTELLFETADSRVDLLVCGGTVFPKTVYFPYSGILGFVWP